MDDKSKILGRLQDVKSEIATKAAQDPDFRSALIENPQRTIEAGYGFEEGSLSGVALSVVEEQPDSILIPIPPDMSEVEMSDDQLDQVAGGRSVSKGAARARRSGRGR